MRTLVMMLGIGVGGAFGALARHLLAYLAHDVIGLPQYVAVMIVNVLGCLLIGLVFMLIEAVYNRDQPSRMAGSRLAAPLCSRGWWPPGDPTAPVFREFAADARAQLASAILITGFLGGMTTFSHFSLVSLQLNAGGDTVGLLVNVVGSVVLGVLATWGGLKLGQLIVLARHPLARDPSEVTQD
ncbi:MAG: CrcB family protein [Planctomycetota bacterium]|nr:CrcB family protein [Planctomycetota bacterium]